MDIVNCWSLHDSGEAISRLKKLAQAVMLRRTKKAMIDLLPRKDLVLKLRFNSAEVEQYKDLEADVRRSLDETLDSDHMPARTYASALTSINLLRRFCNLGVLACSSFERSREKSRQDAKVGWTSQDALESFDNLSAFGPLSCARCGLEDGAEPGLLKPPNRVAAQLSQCFRLLCSNCSSQTKQSPVCDHQPACPVASISPTSSERQTPERDDQDGEIRTLESNGIPTKVQAVTQELKAVTDEKW